MAQGRGKARPHIPCKHTIRLPAVTRFGFVAPGFSPAQPQNADLKVGATRPGRQNHGAVEEPHGRRASPALPPRSGLGTRDSGLGARESEALLKSTLNFELWIASSLLNPRHGWKTREMLLRWLPYRSGSWANPHPETAHPHKFRSPFEPEFGLISPVVNLHAADLQAGEGKDDDGQDQDSYDGCGAGGGSRIDGNEGEEAAPVQGGRFRHRHRAERL